MRTFSLKNVAVSSLFIVLASATLLAQANPVPFISQPLSPASISPGHASFTLAVRGAGFRSGATINWNGHALKTTVVSGGLVRAVVPASQISKASTGSVTVSNPGTIASNVIYLPVRVASSNIGVVSDSSTTEAGEVTVGDFNNDNHPDIAVANLNSATDALSADVYLNTGNAKFTKVPNPSAGVDMLERGNVAADFNNDGNLDTAICSSTGSADESCQIFLGDGKGGLTATNHQTLGPGVAADVNGDGNLDMVVVFEDCCVEQLFIYPGNGDGTFSSFAYVVTLNASYGGYPVVGDFNGDGNLDVAVGAFDDDYVAVFLGNGDGTFQSEIDYPVPAAGSIPLVADINHDGKLDILAPSKNGTVSILLGNGDGSFVVGTSANLPSGITQLADVNGDGILDLVSLSVASGKQTLNIARGNGDGTFQSPKSFPAGADPGLPGFLWIADFNNDGLLDFAAPSTVLLQTSGK